MRSVSLFGWGIKEHVRDGYAEKNYEEVVLHFILLQQIDCVLEETSEEIIETFY